HLAETPIGPRQQQSAGKRGGKRRDLCGDAVRLEPEAVRRDHAEPRNLRDREIDEDDPTAEHLAAKRHVRREHEDAREQRRADDAERIEIHDLASSSVFTTTPNILKRSSVPGTLPTVCGSTTYGIIVRLQSHSEAFASSSVDRTIHATCCPLC